MRGSGAITDSTDWTLWPKTALLSNPRARGISYVARFAWTALYWNVAVVLWGALVRATGSGAGCGDRWPLCNGVVVPRAPRIETVIEFTHRATSGLALVGVAGLCVWAVRLFPRGHRARLFAA